MRIKAKSLFNIGDMVKFKGAETRFVIGGVHVETCPGGMQIHYNGMVLAPSFGIREKFISEKMLLINECFLEVIPPEPPRLKVTIKDRDAKMPGFPLSAGMKIKGRNR